MTGEQLLYEPQHQSKYVFEQRVDAVYSIDCCFSNLYLTMATYLLQMNYIVLIVGYKVNLASFHHEILFW